MSVFLSFPPSCLLGFRSLLSSTKGKKTVLFISVTSAVVVVVNYTKSLFTTITTSAVAVIYFKLDVWLHIGSRYTWANRGSRSRFGPIESLLEELLIIVL